MSEPNALQQEVSRILSEKVVGVVVGFENGSLPMRAQPAFFRKKGDVKRLVANGFCVNNLASLLKQFSKDEKVGVICRGCESRAIRALIVEQQLKRENIYLIGIPCTGILDWREITRAVGQEILKVEEGAEEFVVTCADGKHTFKRSDYLHSACRQCQQPDPVGVDIEIGEFPSKLSQTNAASQVEVFSAKTEDERYAFFEEETDRCIRCYACREACPMCYCTECFVDHITPRWCESMISPGGTQAWHIIRAFHQTGRCVSCGACERACPMEIKMEYITDRLNKDMKAMYGFEVGASDSQQPPFAAFSLDDSNRFVK